MAFVIPDTVPVKVGLLVGALPLSADRSPLVLMVMVELWGSDTKSPSGVVQLNVRPRLTRLLGSLASFRKSLMNVPRLGSSVLFALASKAVCTAVDIGLVASLVS